MGSYTLFWSCKFLYSSGSNTFWIKNGLQSFMLPVKIAYQIATRYGFDEFYL